MSSVYEVVKSEVKFFVYKTPYVIVNDDGELTVHFSRDESSYSYIKKITFLSILGRNNAGECISYTPIDVVNRFLLLHHIDDGKQESDQYSKALSHFFSFIIKKQNEWDDNFDEDVYEEGVDPPRPRWDYMTSITSERITFQYRKHLLDALRNQTGISGNTAKAYINAVVKFYSFHIKNGYYFNNPPFSYEIIKIQLKANATVMSNEVSKYVQTTDMRIRVAKSSRNEGGVIESYRRDLRPLSNQQWKEAEKILLESHQVIKKINGRDRMSHLAIEYRLLFLICRYTGMRREEAASLHLGQIELPRRQASGDYEKRILHIGIGDQFGSMTKTNGVGNKSRVTIIPSLLMDMLYTYSRSSRYQTRYQRFVDYCEQKKDTNDVGFFRSEDSVVDGKKFLFLSAKGKPFLLNINQLNNRWNEVRDTVSLLTGHKMEHSIHNLRSTFAVNIFRACLQKVSAERSLAYVSALLGHEDLKTTMLYLRIAQDEPTGDEIYEGVLEWLDIFDDLKS